MQVINLKKYYPLLYQRDTYMEVPDEVADALLAMYREENAYNHKLWYHKAYYSLDADDFIELHSEDWEQPSSEDILLTKEEEAHYLLTLDRLEEALAHLTPIQAQRIRGYYFSGINGKMQAKAEGVLPGVIYRSNKTAIKRMKKYFQDHDWRKTAD